MGKQQAQIKAAALSVAEFSRAIGVSNDHTRRQIEAQNLKAIRFGRRVLIPAAELDRILAGK